MTMREVVQVVLGALLIVATGYLFLLALFTLA